MVHYFAIVSVYIFLIIKLINSLDDLAVGSIGYHLSTSSNVK